MTPLQRFNQQIPNGLANAFRNNWTEIAQMSDGYFRMLLGFAEIDNEKRQWFVDAAIMTYQEADPETYDMDYLGSITGQLKKNLIKEEAV